MTYAPGDAQPGAGASELLSVSEVARMLGISRTLGYELVARQELPSVRFGTRVYVLRRAVALLVGAGEDEPGIDVGTRPAERSARRRLEPDGQAAAVAPPAPGPELRLLKSRPRRSRPAAPTQLTLFAPTDQPSTTTPTDAPTRRSRRTSTPSPSSAIPRTDPHRAVQSTLQPDTSAPGVRQRGASSR